MSSDSIKKNADGPSPAAKAARNGKRKGDGTLSRRGFLEGAATAGMVAGLAIAGAPKAKAATRKSRGAMPPPAGALGPENPAQRRTSAYRLRGDAARQNFLVPVPQHPNNGDEALPGKIGSYSKGLQHNALGEVLPSSYESLIDALESGDPADFENIQMGNPNLATRFKLVNPQSGLAFDLEGTDSHQCSIPPAPSFSSAWEAGEIVENYWMALLRDVPFTDYATNPLALAAAADLSALSDFRGPKQGGVVTPQTLFRESLPDVLAGPYVSQFFWFAQPFGAQYIEPKMQTTVPGLDYMTNQAEWLDRQNGILPAAGNVFDTTLRYMRNGRDLGQWVHVDVLFQAYFQGMLTMLQGPNPDPRFSGLAAGANPGNPYNTSATQFGFGTLGGPAFATKVCEVATRALKAQWFQKWYVHRRLRPEVFAGRVHIHATGQANYPIHSDVLNSAALAQVFSQNGTYFLPMAFPEGSPTHPAYGAGHATVAGACVTVLKAMFDCDRPFTDLAAPVVATTDGTAVVPYLGADAAQMTVGGELNKLAMNVAYGRNIAGVHWRTDGIESLKLGETIAISILRDQNLCLNEAFAGYTFTKFDGTQITV